MEANSIYKELLNLIKKNELGQLKFLINNKNIKLDDLNSQRIPPLVYAIERNVDKSIIDYLLSINLNVNTETAVTGKNSLFSAIEKKKFAMANFLIREKNADINYINSKSENVVIYLLKKKTISWTSLLFALNHGLNVNYQDKKGKTCLMYAVKQKKVELVKALLQFYIYDNDFILNVVRWSRSRIKVGQQQWINLIDKEFQKLDLNLKDKKGESALYKACLVENLQMVQWLIESRAEVNTKNYYGWSPLILASYNGHLQMVKLLIENGANVNDKNDKGNTPLIAASFNGHEAIAQLLIDHGAKVNEKNHEHWSPATFACSVGHKGLVRLLIKHGAEINHQNSDGWSLLMLAIDIGHETLTKLLLEHGADVHAKENSGYTPLMIAMANDYNSIVKLLIKHGANNDEKK